MIPRFEHDVCDEIGMQGIGVDLGTQQGSGLSGGPPGRFRFSDGKVRLCVL